MNGYRLAERLGELYPGAKGNLAEIGLGIRIDAEYAFLPFGHNRSIYGISEIRYSAGRVNGMIPR